MHVTNITRFHNTCAYLHARSLAYMKKEVQWNIVCTVKLPRPNTSVIAYSYIEIDACTYSRSRWLFAPTWCEKWCQCSVWRSQPSPPHWLSRRWWGWRMADRARKTVGCRSGGPGWSSWPRTTGKIRILVVKCIFRWLPVNNSNEWDIYQTTTTFFACLELKAIFSLNRINSMYVGNIEGRIIAIILLQRYM